jgi:integrase
MVRKKKFFRLPKLRLHKASGRGVVELSGKQFYLGKHGSAECQAAYDKLVGEWLAHGKKPLQVVVTTVVEKPVQGLAVIELTEQYLDHASTYYVANGKQTSGVQRAKIAARIMLQHYSTTPATDFGPLKLRAVQQQLVESGRSRKYCNALTDTITKMFRWGASLELCPPAIYHALQTVPRLKMGRSDARDAEPVRPVSETVLQATLPHLGQIVRDMVLVQRRGGMRPNEVCSLRPADIDRAGDIWIYRPAVHKLSYLGRERVIPIGPKAQEVLAPYLNRPASLNCFSPKEALILHLAERNLKRRTPKSCGNTIGSNRKKQPLRPPQLAYTTMTYGKAISRACRKAFPAPRDLTPEEKKQWHREHRWQPNQLRHLAATELRAMGSIQDAQDFLGHSEPATTLIYAERNLGRLIELAKKYG